MKIKSKKYWSIRGKLS